MASPPNLKIGDYVQLKADVIPVQHARIYGRVTEVIEEPIIKEYWQRGPMEPLHVCEGMRREVTVSWRTSGGGYESKHPPEHLTPVPSLVALALCAEDQRSTE